MRLQAFDPTYAAVVANHLAGKSICFVTHWRTRARNVICVIFAVKHLAEKIICTSIDELTVSPDLTNANSAVRLRSMIFNSAKACCYIVLTTVSFRLQGSHLLWSITSWCIRQTIALMIMKSFRSSAIYVRRGSWKRSSSTRIRSGIGCGWISGLHPLPNRS